MKKKLVRYEKHSTSVGKPTKVHSFGKTLLVWGIVLVFTLPIFRSGLKHNLSFAQFVLNHTIFGDSPEFIPKEDYEGAFSQQ